jgi:hypothetical protein
MTGVWRRRLNASFDQEEKLDKGSSKGETKNYRRDEMSIASQASECQPYALVTIIAPPHSQPASTVTLNAAFLAAGDHPGF